MEWCSTAQRAHTLDSCFRGEGTEEDRSCAIPRVSDDVEAGMYAIDQVHVSAPNLAEHPFRSSTRPAVGVRGRILSTAVCFSFDDTPDEQFPIKAANESLAEQPACDRQRWGGEKRA